MKKLILPALIALFSFTPVVEEWQTITLADNITVNMPGKPVEEKEMGVPAQKVTLEDGTELGASAVDFTTFGMTEEMISQMAGTDEFSKQIETGITMQPGLKLLKSVPGKYNDKYPSIEMTLEVDKPEYKGTMIQRMVFYKKYGITLVYKGGKNDNPEMRDKFFNSLKIAE